MENKRGRRKQKEGRRREVREREGREKLERRRKSKTRKALGGGVKSGPRTGERSVGFIIKLHCQPNNVKVKIKKISNTFYFLCKENYKF